jgi:hypothetical protein
MPYLELHLIGHDLPGRTFCEHDAVHVGVQERTREHVVDLVPGDAPEARFTVRIQVILDGEEMDFRGPAVQGKRGERFVYLSWGQLHPDGTFQMFRRAKLFLADLPPDLVAHALATGTSLEGRLRLTGERGGPVCAWVRPPRITWQAAETQAAS